jgi:hypothetical protein
MPRAGNERRKDPPLLSESHMDGQRQRSSLGRGRRKKANPTRAERPEPVMIVARRPDSPLLAKVPKRKIAASAVPRRAYESAPAAEEPDRPAAAVEPARRTARIVQLMGDGSADDRERERRKLLARVMASQGRGSITRAADEFLRHGFELPDEQEVHLQLLEHFDETRARESLTAMSRLLESDPPIKKPVLDQRLRRLEEHADETITRDLAASLRRALRS